MLDPVPIWFSYLIEPFIFSFGWLALFFLFDQQENIILIEINNTVHKKQKDGT